MKPKQWVPWIIRLGSVALVSVLTGQITTANVNHNDNQTAINEKENVNGNQSTPDPNGSTIDDGLNGTDGYIGGDDRTIDPGQNFGSNNSQGSSGFTRPNRGGGNNTRTHGS
ncbi:hypothetical protein JJB07_04945 [Tumebacillus sp. ITR2]|uniref:Uncharacterized protein n=1 Tax=Tumebacillus amylolyticus TaxID=2801339 RepID=A0ABS1J8M1_9BACL|nr:hypothetical protein [Tumebacillus amylolyticus]MBL0385993.1 hypothetical protein [Tumebacillus amylolyticus]